MANEVKVVTVSVSAFTKGIASLASSLVGVGWQTTMVTNSSRWKRVGISASIKQGTSPTGNRGVYLYALRSDENGTPIRTDGAGASSAAWTRVGARMFTTPDGMYPSVLQNKASPSTGDVLSGIFLLENPGPAFGVGIVHDTGVALDSTEGNHVISYWNWDDEIQ